MLVEYTLDPQDIAAARLLAIGIRPRLESMLFAVTVAAELSWSVSPWKYELLPLLIGMTAGLAGFRLIQINQVTTAALAAYHRNPTLRLPTAASWDENGVTIQPANAPPERISWMQLKKMRENERILLLLQPTGTMHAIPKRAFPDRSVLVAFRRLATARAGRNFA